MWTVITLNGPNHLGWLSIRIRQPLEVGEGWRKAQCDFQDGLPPQTAYPPAP